MKNTSKLALLFWNRTETFVCLSVVLFLCTGKDNNRSEHVVSVCYKTSEQTVAVHKCAACEPEKPEERIRFK